MKNLVKAVLSAGLFGISSLTVLATPIDISMTGTAPAHQWSGVESIFESDFQFEDVVQAATQPVSPVNIAGVNSIQVTWNAPAGYMYVVNPPPADFQKNNLEFSLWFQLGQPGQASSLGSIISQSTSMNLVYGNPTQVGGVTLDNNPVSTYPPFDSALTFADNVYMSPNTAAFAFTSVTMDATFSGTGVSELLSPNAFGDSPAQFFAVLWGLPTIIGAPFNGPSNPGELFSLEPLPVEGSVPETTSTLTLAGMSFLGLMLCGRKFSLKEEAAK